MTETEDHQTRTPGAPAGRPVPTRMRAAVHPRYGPVEEIRLREVDVPAPGAGQVLLEVHAAGVDRGVWHLTTGRPHLIRLAGFGLRAPHQPVPGMDVSGRVVALGPGVSGLRVGDEVFGIGTGTYAEYALAREDRLVTRPAGLGCLEAAAVGVSGLAALQAVHDVGRVRAGQRVLVLGASGGVGAFAVQLAVAAGADVTGVASAAKLDLVRSLGAGRAVDYATEDPTGGDRRYDLVIDVGGRRPLRRLRRVLAADGTLVIVGGEDGGSWTGGVGRQLRAAVWSRLGRRRMTSFISSESREDLQRLRSALEAGDVLVPLDRVHPLAEAPAALVRLAAGRVRGKSVVVPRSDGPHTG